MKTTLKTGATVTLLTGAANPVLVEWTVTKVTRTKVTLVAPGHLFPQTVCRELVVAKLK